MIGSGGAGKTTFAKELGARLNIEVIHLDSIYWNPGWVETPKAEWLKTVEGILKRDSWIMDGNYSGTLDVRLQACDTVVFLDISRLICVWRVFKRLLKYRKRSRPDMAEGCHERLDVKFLAWIWGYHKRTKPKIMKMLREHSESKNVIRLRSPIEVEEFLSNALEMLRE